MQAVKMYTTAYCPYCTRAKQVLQSKGVAQIEEIRIDSDPAQRAVMMESTGRRTVPQIFIGDTHVGGCDDLIALDQRGVCCLCSSPEFPLSACPLTWGLLLGGAVTLPLHNGRLHARGAHRAASQAPSISFSSERQTTMADQENPVFQIQRVYLKDASLEQPNSPAILLEQTQPSVDIQLGVEATPVADGIYEVAVTATVQTKIEDKTVFLVEAKQAGIFEIRGIPEDQMGAVIGVACPQIVYPYLRGNVADIVTRAGFPPVHLAEINFQAMYEQQQAQANGAGAGAALAQ